MCLWNFNSKYPTDHLLYHFENAYFEWKQKNAVFVHVSLNANELLLPAPFSRIELCLYSWYLRYSARNICLVLIIISIALKSCVLNHISLNFWYMAFWAHIFEARAQKAAVTRHESRHTKLSFHELLRLNCQIQKLMLKSHELHKQSVMSVKVNSWERNHVYCILDLCSICSNIQ